MNTLGNQISIVKTQRFKYKSFIWALGAFILMNLSSLVLSLISGLLWANIITKTSVIVMSSLVLFYILSIYTYQVVLYEKGFIIKYLKKQHLFMIEQVQEVTLTYSERRPQEKILTLTLQDGHKLLFQKKSFENFGDLLDYVEKLPVGLKDLTKEG